MSNKLAMNALTGELLWEYQHVYSSASPIEANGIVFVGSIYGFYAIHLPVH